MAGSLSTEISDSTNHVTCVRHSDLHSRHCRMHSRHTRMYNIHNTNRSTYRKMHSSLNKIMIISFGWKPDFADGWRM